MKVQVGVLQRDGSPASLESLADLLAEVEGYDAEISGHFLGRCLAMAYRGNRLTPEEEHEVQPFQHGSHVMTWDGRLDNRLDVGRRLALDDPQRFSDSFIVLHAYMRYGDAIFSDLVGDFACCLGDMRTDSVVFARSTSGTRCLYYVLTDNKLVWSSDFASLVRSSNASVALDEEYVISYLAARPDPMRTPLRAVGVIEPGTYVRFENNTFTPTCSVWKPNTIKPIHYRTDNEYEEHCRSLLKEAVKVRLRSRSPVFAELSGGLDSSSIVVVADNLIANGDGLTRSLYTLSCIYAQSETCDERFFISTIANQRNGNSLYVHEHDQEVTLGLRNISFSGLPSPLHCFPGRYRKYASLMSERGARVLLSGSGGDALFWSGLDGAVPIADHLWNLNASRIHRDCRRWSEFTATPYPRLLWRAICLTLRSLVSQGLEYQTFVAPSWLHKRFKAWRPQTISDRKVFTERWVSPGYVAHASVVRLVLAQLGAGYLSEYRNVHVTYPYTHQPLLEFCLGIPKSQLLRDGVSRSIMRRALKNHLPATILHRKSKGSIAETFARALQREWSDIGDIKRWEVCERELVEPTALYEALMRTKSGLQGNTSGSLTATLSLERWLRSLRLPYKHVPARSQVLSVART